MDFNFELNQEKLIDVAGKLEEKVVDGLKKENQQIKCLLTYVPALKQPLNRRAIVLDLGGTNVRAAIMNLDNAPDFIEKGPVEAALPLKRGEPLDREIYLDVQSDLIASLNPPENLPLGYCFSYPAKSTFDGDAVLLKWTKEVFVPGTVGEPAGQLLLDNLQKHDIRCSNITVINDTVAAMIAGVSKSEMDAYIGLIVDQSEPGRTHRLSSMLE